MPIRSQEPLPGLPRGVQGPKALGRPLLLSRATGRELDGEAGLPGLEPAPIWDPGRARRGPLTTCATVPGPTLGKNLMSVVCVEKLLPTSQNSFIIRESTQVNSLINVVSVEKLLFISQASLDIRESTLRKNLMNVVSVENLLVTTQVSFIIRKGTQVKILMNVVSVGKGFFCNPHLFRYRRVHRGENF